MGAPKLHEDHSPLRAAHQRVIDALRELANLRDDHGLPTMGLDNIRREIVTMKARLIVSNDNNQPGDSK